MRASLVTGIAIVMLANTAQHSLAQRRVTHEELVYVGPSSAMMSQQIGASSIDILEHDLGDLNGDGSDEFVAAVETPKIIDGARERLVVIFQKQQGKWMLWKFSEAPILNSEEGGVLGDPFDDIGIQDQVLFISHYGGSNWRWSMEDGYRFDGEDIILSEHRSYWGSFCDEKVEWEIDLTKGIAHCASAREECPEGFGDNGHVDSIPKMEAFEIPNTFKIKFEQRNDSTIRFVSPKHGMETSL
ncbi:hypothetical protein N9M80_02160 [Flavobacteriales bacterium]|jgi:hypothetical protein|nr:hypothetical protein [Flavobacteriales bacterium]